MKIPFLYGTAAALLMTAAGAASAFAQAPEPSATPSKPAAEVSPSPSASPSPTAAKVGKKMLEKYDLNKDGVLDADETAAMEKDRSARKAENLQKYDKNGDGKLDDAERAAMRADRDKEKVKQQEK